MEWWGYWWLIFPLMGVAGGAARAWEKGAKRRHERRLEMIKVKGQIRSAKAGEIAAPATPSESVPDTKPAQLERLFAAHDDVTARWLDYELDVAKLIAFPAMSDGRQPLTAAFLRAKRVADGARPAAATASLSREQFAEYRDAVTDYEVAFDVAERDARRLKDSSFSQVERKRLDTAKQLLTVAIDQAATPAERQLAYRRVREELDGLISVSDEAIDVLEKKVALELTSGIPAPSQSDPRRESTAARRPVNDADAARTADPVSAADPAPEASVLPPPLRETKPAGRVVRPKPGH